MRKPESSSLMGRGRNGDSVFLLYIPPLSHFTVFRYLHCLRGVCWLDWFILVLVGLETEFGVGVIGGPCAKSLMHSALCCMECTI